MKEPGNAFPTRHRSLCVKMERKKSFAKCVGLEGVRSNKQKSGSLLGVGNCSPAARAMTARAAQSPRKAPSPQPPAPDGNPNIDRGAGNSLSRKPIARQNFTVSRHAGNEHTLRARALPLERKLRKRRHGYGSGGPKSNARQTPAIKFYQ